MGESPETERGHNNRPLLEGLQLTENSLEVIEGQPVIPSLMHVITELLNIDPKQRSEEITRIIRLSDGPRSLEADRHVILHGPNQGKVKTTLRLTEIGVMRVSLALLDNSLFHLGIRPNAQNAQLILEGAKPELQQLAYEEVVNAAALMGLPISPPS